MISLKYIEPCYYYADEDGNEERYDGYSGYIYSYKSFIYRINTIDYSYKNTKPDYQNNNLKATKDII